MSDFQQGIGPSIIAGGSGLLGGIINAASTAHQNRLSRQFSREMYDRTRADNLEFWNMQNEYNSPQAQMKRLQDANLNPAMMYGSSGGGGNAGSIPTPDVQPAQFRTPEWGNAISQSGLSFLNSMYDLDIKQAQAKNLEAQNSVILQDAMLRAVQTQKLASDKDRVVFDLDFARELRSTNADALRELVRQRRVATDNSIEENARRAVQSSTSVTEAFERMRNMQESRLNLQSQRATSEEERRRIRADIDRIKATTLNLYKDNVLKDMELSLRKQGLNPNDPLWSRIVAKGLSDYFNPSSSDGSKSIFSMFSKLFGR